MRLDLNSCVELPIQSSALNKVRRFFVGVSHTLTPLQSTLENSALKGLILKTVIHNALVFLRTIYNIDII